MLVLNFQCLDCICVHNIMIRLAENSLHSPFDNDTVTPIYDMVIYRILTKDTPYLALTGEAWGVFCEFILWSILHLYIVKSQVTSCYRVCIWHFQNGVLKPYGMHWKDDYWKYHQANVHPFRKQHVFWWWGCRQSKIYGVIGHVIKSIIHWDNHGWQWDLMGHLIDIIWLVKMHSKSLNNERNLKTICCIL